MKSALFPMLPALGPRTPPSKVDHERNAAAGETLVIVGNGMVGFKLCEQLVNRGRPAGLRIVVFGEEPCPAYDRVHLTEVFSGRTPESLQLAPRSWYQENGLELRTGDAVAAIDRVERTVRSESGVEVRYDRLVFATGSAPFVPPMEGSDLPGVFLYRSIEHLDAIIKAATGHRRAAVIGGGLLGLEAARALRDLGMETHVVERGGGLMPRQLDPDGARLLQHEVEAMGVRVYLGRQLERIEAVGPERLLTFAGGVALSVDLVVIAAGIRPRDEVAAQCGLECHPAGGIIVDERLRTSDPQIFAVGECVRFRGEVFGLVAPGYRMAEALSATLTGEETEFLGADRSSRLKLLGVEVASLGDPFANDPDGRNLVYRTERHYRKLVIRGGRLVGAAVVGEWPDLGRIQDAVLRRQRIWSWQAERFRTTGNPWRPRPSRSVADWPPGTLVCICNGVSRGALSCAISQGCATIQDLNRCTGAGTACGSCIPLLVELTGTPATPVPSNGRTALLLGSVAAVLLALAILFLAPVPLSTSTQGGWRLDSLWREGFWKQVTGFTQLGLSAASLIISARKRLKRFTAGDYGAWRALHGALGASTLAVLMLHTGLRLGQGLNFALMLTFLSLGLLGGLSGGVTALERGGNAAVGAVRSFLTHVHTLLFWPAVALVTLHVAAVYYF